MISLLKWQKERVCVGPSRSGGLGSSLVAVCVIAFSASSEAQNLAWAASIGSEGDDVAREIAIDDDGNVLNAGYFEGTVDLDPGAGELLLTSNGFNDIYVQKLTADGDLIWAFSAGGDEFDMATAIGTDATGDIYVTGGYSGTVDLDPGAGVTAVTSEGGQDIYLAKYSADGDLLWARSFGGPEYDESTALAVGASGIYLLSYFSATIDADPGAGVLSIASAGGLDILLQKFNDQGDLVWAQATGSTETELGLAIALDAAENIWFTGSFEGALDFDPGMGELLLTSAGAWDIFVTKRSTDGDLLWAGRMGGVENFDTGYDIAVDGSDNVIVVGSFFGSGDFDPGVGVHTLTAASMGSDDVFVLKLDQAGDFLWAESFGGADADLGYGVAVTTDGRIDVTGYFSGTADFDPDPIESFEMTTSSPDNFFDSFVSQLSADGEFIHAWQFGGASSIATASIALDEDDSIFLAGHFEAAPDFDPTASVHSISSVGFRDAFILRFDDINTGVRRDDRNVTPMIYPNPASDHVMIEVGPGAVGAVLVIYDENGRIVSTEQIKSTSTRISVETFAAGRYQVRLSDEVSAGISFMVVR